MKIPTDKKLIDLIKSRTVYGDNIEAIRNQTPEEHHTEPYCDGDTVGAWTFVYTEPCPGCDTYVRRVIESRSVLRKRLDKLILDYPQYEEQIRKMAKINSIPLS